MENATLLNRTSNFTNTHLIDEPAIEIFAFNFIVCFAIFLFNGLTMNVICKVSDDLQRRFSVIFGLTISDLIIGMAAMGILVLRTYELFYKVNWFLCITGFSLLETGTTSSLFHTFCICFERFLAVRKKNGVKRQYKFKTRVKFTIISTTLIGIFFVCWKVVTPVDIGVCSLPAVYGDYYRTFLKIVTCTMFLPLLLGTIVLYLLTVWVLKTRLKRIDVKIANSSFYIGDDRQQIATCSSSLQMQRPGQVIGVRKLEGMTMDKNTNRTTILTEIDRETDSTKCKIMGSNYKEDICTELASKKRDKSGLNREEICITVSVKDVKTTFTKVTNVSNSTKVNTHNKISIDLKGCSTRVKQNYKLKAIKTIGLLVLVLTLFTGPGIIILMIEGFCSQCEISERTKLSFLLLWFFNSALNPCIYSLTIDEFSDFLKRSIPICKK